MRSLPRPTFDMSAKMLFETCVSSYSDISLRTNLLSCSSLVEYDSEKFIKFFPSLLHDIDQNPILPIGITKDQIKKVYSDKFVAKNSPGRKYYDIIFSAPRGGKCPICGERIVKNLDHYLPKAAYCTLVVSPNNLIPICRDCNFDKRAYTISRPEDAPLHPYFDNVSNEVWLVANLLPARIVLYDVNCPTTWSEVLKSRVKNHLLLYNLHEFYTSKAAQEVADEIYYWAQILEDGGQIKLLDHLKGRCASIERNELNSWKAALYRGLVNQFSEVLKWLI